MIRFKQKIALIFFGLFLFLVCFEVGLRLASFVFLSVKEHRNEVSLSQQGAFRILCLGESTTALGGSASYPSQLEIVLNQRHPEMKFSVINAGIGGINTKAILTMLEDNLNKYHPDLVLIMMGINDTFIKQSYGPHRYSRFQEFLKTFKIYQWLCLLCQRIVSKAQALGIYRLNEGKGAFDPAEYLRTESSYIGKMDYAQAQKVLEKSLRQKPADPWLAIALSRSLMGQNKFSEAEGVLKKAIESNPENYWVYKELGKIYERKGWNDLVEDALKKAISLKPLSYGAYRQLGVCYIRQGRLSEAEQAFKKAAEISPHMYSVFIALGDCYIQEDRFSEAEEAFKIAIDIQPELWRPYAHLASCYAIQGKRQLAAQYYAQANRLKLKFYDPETRINYNKIKEIIMAKGIRLVCVQYPMCAIEPLKKLLWSTDGVVFVDNEQIFKEALKKGKYSDYFWDIFGGDFGHCTLKGNRLLAENIADTIDREFFKR